MNDKKKVEWQPIETAEKNGSHIQLYRPHIQFVGYYADAGWCMQGAKLIDPQPTHWKPLDEDPQPPEKPEPLELWVNEYLGESPDAYHTKEAAEQNAEKADNGPPISGAVHMREVVPVERLKHRVWHEIKNGPSVYMRSDGTVEISDRLIPKDDRHATAVLPSEIPDLIRVLQGLMEGREDDNG